MSNSDLFLEFFKKYAEFSSFFNQLYDRRKKDLLFTGNNKLKLFFSDLAFKTEFFEEEIKFLELSSEALNGFAIDIPGKKIKRMSFIILQAKNIKWGEYAKKIYSLIKSKEIEKSQIKILFNLSSLSKEIRCIIDRLDAPPYRLFFLNEEFPQRYSKVLSLSEGNEVRLKINYVPGVCADAQFFKEVLNSMFENNLTFRESILLISEKILAAVKIVFENEVIKTILGPKFRVDCSVYIKQSDKYGWFSTFFIKKKTYLKKEINIKFRPDQQDLRLYLGTFLIVNDLKFVSSILLHELVHNLHTKENIPGEDGFNWVERIHKEGIAVFAEAIENPEMIINQKLIPFFKRGKPYETISKVGEDSFYYTTGLLMLLGIFERYVHKNQSQNIPSFNSDSNPEYWKNLLKENKREALLLLRLLMRLKVSSFFEYYFQNVGILWFLSLSLNKELAKMLESKKINSILRVYELPRN